MVVKTVMTTNGFRTRYVDNLTVVEDTNVFYSPRITELNKAYIGDNDLLDDFDFRESVLRETLVLMCAPSLKSWTAIQGDMGVNHKGFIVETLKYILGEERTINFKTWKHLLEEDTGSYPLDVDHLFTIKQPIQGPLISSNNRLVRISSDFNTTVNRWISQSNGLGDLLHTMNIIYGN